MERYDNQLNDIADQIIKKQDKQIRDQRWSIISLIVGLILFATLLIIQSHKLKEEQQEIEDCVEELDYSASVKSFEEKIGESYFIFEESINDSILLEYCKYYGATYPEVLVAQAKLETGNYTSKVFKENNNLFGMKKVRVRINFQNGENNGYGTYFNWQLSIIDRIFWDAVHYGDSYPSEDQYIDNLCLGYAEDVTYNQKVKNVVSKLKRK